jgi:type IV secretory pathway VirB2 component (pilin)
MTATHTTAEAGPAGGTASGRTEGRGPEGPFARLADVSIGPFGGTVAVVLVAAGLLVIGIGWNGAAGSGSYVNGVPDIRAQIPWLISGGCLGVALVVIGAALMVTQSHRTDRARLEARLEELSDAVRAMAGGAGGRGRARAAAAAPGMVVAGASSYHRPDCRLVEGRDNAEYLTPAEAQERGLAPCRICKPDS